MTVAFPQFSAVVHAQYERMKGHELLVVDTVDLFETYLKAFPEGTNPIHEKRTEHDCSCCKQFIRNIGNVVAVIDGKIVTVWDDFDKAPFPYNVVGEAVREVVRQAPIKSVWRTKERQYGTELTHELLPDGTVRKWDHFSGKVSNTHFSSKPDQDRGELNTTAQVFRRGLEELQPSAFDSVIELIESRALYKGDEFAPAVRAFQKLLREYRAAGNKSAFVWANVKDRAALFRNTAIGSLLVDLSAGEDLESAVRKYESKVAPLNYKRTTALITPRMIENAMTTLQAEGLEGAIQRRHASLEDVSVNDVLFVNNDVAPRMKDGLTALLMEGVAAPKADIKGAKPISIDDFLAGVVPNATSIDVLLEGRHLSNFMSLTAPVLADTGQLFKWPNDFAWSYDGEVTDSVKQRVKRAGGNVNATLRCSLSWFNFDDLDIHCQWPGGPEIYFHSKQGVLDVDMNVSPSRRDAVENLQWTGRLRDGTYNVFVNNFTRREGIDVGFQMEVEYGGQLHQFSYAKEVKGKVPALTMVVKDGVLTDIKPAPGMIGGGISSEKWNVKTETLVPVDTLMLSPNHWNGHAIGHKHVFFMLRGMKNPDPVRGIYNEFLRPDLDKHRKVLEVLGAKTKAPFADNQLSGVGFSSTKGDTVTVVAKGPKLNQAYHIQF